MSAQQREARNIVIKAHFLLPAFLAMTLIAFFTLLPLMHVILTMTAITIGTHFLIHVTRVTIFASDTLVLASKTKVRLVMIKLGLRPPLGGVAILALFTKLPLVLIGKFMAGVTICLHFLYISIVTLGVALVTGNNLVLTC